MQTFAIAQAKNNFSALLHLVESAEDVVLTRHGKRIARIVLDKEPEISAQEIQLLKIAEAKAILENIRAKVQVGSALDWREARDAGRKY